MFHQSETPKSDLFELLSNPNQGFNCRTNCNSGGSLKEKSCEDNRQKFVSSSCGRDSVLTKYASQQRLRDQQENLSQHVWVCGKQLENANTSTRSFPLPLLQVVLAFGRLKTATWSHKHPPHITSSTVVPSNVFMPRKRIEIYLYDLKHARFVVLFCKISTWCKKY